MKISIVVPTRDRVGKLRKCVDSLAAQGAAGRVSELVVVDDGSRDETPRWLAAAATRPWPFPLKTVRLRHGGPARARNAGIARCRGDVVLFTGDDCVAAPGLLEAHLRAHTAADDDRVSILGHTTWLPSLEITPFMHYQENGGSQFAYWRISDPADTGWSYYYTTNVSTPTRLLDVHRFEERFPAARFEDMELGYRLEGSGHRIEYHKDALVWHDHPVTFDAFHSRCPGYGELAAFFHRLHPDPELARAIGIDDAREAGSWLERGLDEARRAVPRLEAALAGVDLESAAFGVRGTLAMLSDGYRLLIHAALVRGIRRALGLPAPTPLSQSRPRLLRPRGNAAPSPHR
ncbi:MAG: glycosyltransferase [Proteobacteria bacterium]|nr:glycosyltransferase [Pseudomonadota bacterium]